MESTARETESSERKEAFTDPDEKNVSDSIVVAHCIYDTGPRNLGKARSHLTKAQFTIYMNNTETLDHSRSGRAALYQRDIDIKTVDEKVAREVADDPT